MEAIGLKGEIISDGSVELRWHTKQQAHAFSLLSCIPTKLFNK